MFNKKVIDNRKKNTVRKISKETKEIVYERDEWKCVICKMGTAHPEFHHCFFWNQSNYWQNRNDADQLVTLCAFCHHKLHFEWGNNYRQMAIDYITNYYKWLN